MDGEDNKADEMEFAETLKEHLSETNDDDITVREQRRPAVVNLFFLKDLLMRNTDDEDDLPLGHSPALKEKLEAMQKLKDRAHLPAFLSVMKSIFMT